MFVKVNLRLIFNVRKKKVGILQFWWTSDMLVKCYFSMFLKGRLFPIKRKNIFLLRISTYPIILETPPFSVIFIGWRVCQSSYFNQKNITNIKFAEKGSIIFTDHTELEDYLFSVQKEKLHFLSSKIPPFPIIQKTSLFSFKIPLFLII